MFNVQITSLDVKGRVARLFGTVSPASGAKVQAYVFSHDEKWYGQKPVSVAGNGHWSAEVTLGNAQSDPALREFIIVVFGAQQRLAPVLDTLQIPAGAATITALSEAVPKDGF